MNAKLARRIRQAAREELAQDGLPDRDIVAHPKADTTAFNSPMTTRGMIRAMKKAAKKAASNRP